MFILSLWKLTDIIFTHVGKCVLSCVSPPHAETLTADLDKKNCLLPESAFAFTICCERFRLTVFRLLWSSTLAVFCVSSSRPFLVAAYRLLAWFLLMVLLSLEYLYVCLFFDQMMVYYLCTHLLGITLRVPPNPWLKMHIQYLGWTHWSFVCLIKQ